MPHVDYVSEKEAQAICNAALGLGRWHENIYDMTISFPAPLGERGEIRLPKSTVADFMADWKRSGAWSLHGRPEQ